MRSTKMIAMVAVLFIILVQIAQGKVWSGLKTITGCGGAPAGSENECGPGTMDKKEGSGWNNRVWDTVECCHNCACSGVRWKPYVTTENYVYCGFSSWDAAGSTNKDGDYKMASYFIHLYFEDHSMRSSHGGPDAGAWSESGSIGGTYADGDMLEVHLTSAGANLIWKGTQMHQIADVPSGKYRFGCATSPQNAGFTDLAYYQVSATCTNKDGLGGGAVEDVDCGPGMLSLRNSAACSKTPCEITGGKSDFDTCCKAATCGDPTGEDIGAVNDTDCGDGFVYDETQISTECSVGPCEINTGNKTDRAKCCKAICESGACSIGFQLKSNSGSLTCASFNCTASDQSICCDSEGCKVPQVPHGIVSGTGCIAAATVVHGTVCSVKADAAYTCAATSMTCASATMTAPTCKLNDKHDGRIVPEDDEYAGSVSVIAGYATASQVKAAMRSALAKHFGADESKVVTTIKQESSTVLMVKFTISLSSGYVKATTAKMDALIADMSALDEEFMKQLQAAGVDTTNTKTSSFTMSKTRAAMVSTSPTPVLGRVTTLAALWVMLW